MEWQFLLKISVLGIMHWVLALMMLQDLVYRKRVLGGKKAVWAVMIIFFLIIGSFLYLLCHPQIFFGEDR